jgi:hypothetical protein
MLVRERMRPPGKIIPEDGVHLCVHDSSQQHVMDADGKSKNAGRRHRSKP